MLLSLERANAWALLFARLIATLCFFPKPFYFVFNRIARYTQSKESRNLFIKIPQITGKAIFRNCLKKLSQTQQKNHLCNIYIFCNHTYTQSSLSYTISSYSLYIHCTFIVYKIAVLQPLF